MLDIIHQMMYINYRLLSTMTIFSVFNMPTGIIVKNANKGRITVDMKSYADNMNTKIIF